MSNTPEKIKEETKKNFTLGTVFSRQGLMDLYDASLSFFVNSYNNFFRSNLTQKPEQTYNTAENQNLNKKNNSDNSASTLTNNIQNAQNDLDAEHQEKNNNYSAQNNTETNPLPHNPKLIIPGFNVQEILDLNKGDALKDKKDLTEVISNSPTKTSPEKPKG